CSKRMRGPLPKPSRRRASTPWISSTVRGRPAGSPSTITTTPFPWGSPPVRKRSTLAMVPTPPCAPTELFDDLLALSQPEPVVSEQERPAVGAWVQGDHLQVAAEG